jgi:mannose-1-phosphate guanylyltransferase
MITHIFDQLIQVGVQRILINTHHCPGRYAELFPDNHYQNVPLFFRHEAELLETGGGIKNMEDLADPASPLLVYNGDIFSTLPLESLIHHHVHSTNEVTLALRSRGKPLNVRLAADGRILDFRQTLGVTEGKACLFTGIYLINPSFFQYLTARKKESVVETWLRMIQSGNPPGGVILDDGMWSDIGTHEDYENIH